MVRAGVPTPGGQSKPAWQIPDVFTGGFASRGRRGRKPLGLHTATPTSHTLATSSVRSSTAGGGAGAVGVSCTTLTMTGSRR